MFTKKVLLQKNSSRLESISSGLQSILESKDCGAFLMRGSRVAALKQIKKMSDFEETFWIELVTLGIDDVKSQISKTDFSNDTSRLVVFSFYSITLEAQNALLKYLEEPPKNTTIILLTDTSTAFLPTVLSRVRISNFIDVPESTEDCLLFLCTEPALRMNLAFIKKLLLNKSADTEAIDKEAIHIFIESVIELCTDNGVSDLNPSDRKLLQNCISLVSRIKQNGASAKQILEYVSLAVPQR